MISASSGSPAIIAHRGGAGYAPENTLAAFRRTLAQGSARWMEFDIQRSADGELVVFHDAELGRTTDVRSHYPERADAGIGAFTAAELSRLDAGSWFDPSRFAGEPIPTLAETLDLLSDSCGILLELKNAHLYPGIERQLAEELERRGLAGSEDLTVWSFEFDALQRFHTALPTVPLGAFGRTVREIQEAGWIPALSAVGTWPEITEDDLEISRRESMPLVATTFDSVPRMRRAIEWKVDAVVTDYPDVLHDTIAGADPFPAPSRLVFDEVLSPGGGTERTASIRNAGDAPVETAGWYLRHSGTTPFPENSAPLQLGERIELSFSLSTKDAARPGPLPLALHDAEDRLIDLVEY